MKANKKKVVTFTIIGGIAAICLVVSIVLGVLFTKFKRFLVTTHSLGESSTVTREAGESLVKQIQGEGTVLVKNDEKLLPLAKEDVSKVNVFGWAATDWVVSGSGSGQVKNNEKRTVDGQIVTYPLDLLYALQKYGVSYNTELTDMYERFYSNREKSENGGGPNGGTSNTAALKNFNFEFSRLYEQKIADYDEGVLDRAKEFSDTAIVVLGRVEGESNDSPKVQYKLTKKGGSVEVDEDRTYLEISTEEEELLKYVGENYDKVIVLINSTAVMELGFLDEKSDNFIPGLDACLLVQTTGTSGALAIPELIYGDITPSGKTADTWAYDLTTNPTYANTGSGLGNASANSGYGNGVKTPMSTNLYTNSTNDLYPMFVQHTNGSSNINYDGVPYTDYQEGIYVGYKWYETADKEGFWSGSFAKDNWGVTKYEEVVQYPFGYGMSYTTFDWDVIAPDNLNVTESTIDEEIVFQVTVTNTGDVKGQDVVELYAEPPYTNGGVEKSAVNLVAFSKTLTTLDAKTGSELVELRFKARDLASYDFENKTGLVPNGGYVLEKGTYTLTFKTDAHNAKAGVSTYELKVGKDIAITKDESGNTISNKFTGDSAMDGVALDGNSDGSAGTEIKYMERDKFESTFPITQAPNRAMTDEIKKYNIYNAQYKADWDEAHADAVAPTMGSKDTDIKLYDDSAKSLTDEGRALGLDYNSPDWGTVLNQVTLTEMRDLVLHGYAKTSAISSIGKPATKDQDGPNQICSFSVGSNDTGFSSIVLAQTWNTELAYSMGKQMGDDCNSEGVQGWYGPGVNIHRSPFNGRNYEYYSEDPLITGLMCANAVEGAKYAGVFCYLKHLALYETESFRDGMYTWLTEQAFREIYLKPFEISIKHKDRYGIDKNGSGSTAIMTSYGRAGAVWTGGSVALLSDEGVLRGEWGFTGATLTDYADYHQFMNGDQMVRAGGDLWMDGYLSNGSFDSTTDINNDAAFQQALRRATKNVVYMWLNALTVNEKYNEGVELYNKWEADVEAGLPEADPDTPYEGAINDTAVSTPSGFEYDFDWTILVTVLFTVAWVAGLGVWLLLTILKGRKKKPAVADGGEEAASDDNAKAEAKADDADKEE